MSLDKKKEFKLVDFVRENIPEIILTLSLVTLKYNRGDWEEQEEDTATMATETMKHFESAPTLIRFSHLILFHGNGRWSAWVFSAVRHAKMTDKTWFLSNKVEINLTGDPNINLYNCFIIQDNHVFLCWATLGILLKQKNLMGIQNIEKTFQNQLPLLKIGKGI